MAKDQLLFKLVNEELARRISRETNCTGEDIRECTVGLRDVAPDDYDNVILWLREWHTLNRANEDTPVHKPEVPKDPFEVAKSAGYTLYGPLKSSKDFEQFREYYRKSELLCKFGCDDRAKRAKVFWLVKDGAKDISPEFPEGERNKPLSFRDGPYGTSVMSVEMFDGFVRLCNRYNHGVSGCDNTLNSDLNKIAPGFAKALADFAGVRLGGTTSITNAVVVEGKLFVYTDEIDGVQFNVYENAYIRGGKIIKGSETDELVLANMIFDIKNPQNTRQLSGNYKWTWLPDGISIKVHPSLECARNANKKAPDDIHLVPLKRGAKEG